MSAFHPLPSQPATGKKALMRPRTQSTVKVIWRTISISSALVAIGLLIWALRNSASRIETGFCFHDAKALPSIGLWCVAFGLSYKMTSFARDRADRIDTPREELSGYPKTLRIAGLVGLIIAAVGVANFALWHWAIGDASQKEMLGLAWMPLFLVSYYVMAYGEPTDR